MPKMTFVCEHQHPIRKDINLSKITFESNRDTIDDIVADFEDFLRGCGFVVDGKLEIANKEDISLDGINLDFGYDSMDSGYTPSFDTMTLDTITLNLNETEHNDYYYDKDRNR